jgi:hypothetical protein
MCEYVIYSMLLLAAVCFGCATYLFAERVYHSRHSLYHYSGFEANEMPESIMTLLGFVFIIIAILLEVIRTERIHRGGM